MPSISASRIFFLLWNRIHLRHTKGVLSLGIEVAGLMSATLQRVYTRWTPHRHCHVVAPVHSDL